MYTYSGPDVMSHFYEFIRKEHELICEIFQQQEPMGHLSAQQQLDFDAAVACGTCKGKFSEDNPKVRHHCHVTGEFIGATCNSCNLQLKPRKKFKKARYFDDENPQGEWEWAEPPKSKFDAESLRIFAVRLR